MDRAICIQTGEFHAARAQLPLLVSWTADRRFQAPAEPSDSLRSAYRFAPADSVPLPFADWFQWLFDKPGLLCENPFAPNTKYPIADGLPRVRDRDALLFAAAIPVAQIFPCLLSPFAASKRHARSSN